VSCDPLTAPPVNDADVAAWASAPGLTDLYVHFLPDQVTAAVRAFFDQTAEHYGTREPVHYRLPHQALSSTWSGHWPMAHAASRCMCRWVASTRVSRCSTRRGACWPR
jgi:hypothetical protein